MGAVLSFTSQYRHWFSTRPGGLGARRSIQLLDLAIMAIRTSVSSSSSRASNGANPPKSSLANTAVDFSRQAEKLSHVTKDAPGDGADVAVEARFITPHDPVIVTTNGNRLPGVPLAEAHKLNILKDELEDSTETVAFRDGKVPSKDQCFEVNDGSLPEGHKADKLTSPPNTSVSPVHSKSSYNSQTGSLGRQMPPSHTNPLFPPLPLYGPPSLLRDLQCVFLRVSSFFLSLGFLAIVVLGALFTSIPGTVKKMYYRMTFRNIDKTRPFYEEEARRKAKRQDLDRRWKAGRSTDRLATNGAASDDDVFIPTEGGPDPIVCDPGYYARRVGLDIEEFQVQTEDGFIIDLWHVYDPKEYTKMSDDERADRGPDLFTQSRKRLKDPTAKKKFPVLLMHGLLQSAGAYCVNDDDSLAFYLCKAGYDVWLGNNRCGFEPKHVLLEYSDPRMWCWNIRQMGVFDLPALTSRVLFETGFEKIGLIAHSQGTTQTLVALAKEQRPDLGEKLTVFCALAPACYAGPLIGKAYFKFMRIITPGMFRIIFGIHAFISQMMVWHRILPPRIYGWMGYKVFSFLFDWSDTRWDRGLRNRMFQFAPVYVSAESMRWWLGRECFARHKCILATRESVRAEEQDDHADDRGREHALPADEADVDTDNGAGHDDQSSGGRSSSSSQLENKPRGYSAWYNEQAPPFALWVAGDDDLVDGRKLLRRFERGREPHVRVVHQNILDDYEHLDVIWAMDAPERVFKEIREVLWKTCDARDVCRTPTGCEGVKPLASLSRATPGNHDAETD